MYAHGEEEGRRGGRGGGKVEGWQSKSYVMKAIVNLAHAGYAVAETTGYTSTIVM